MRVFELATELGMPSKKLVSMLRGRRMTIVSHLSQLTPEQERIARESVSTKERPQEVGKLEQRSQHRSFRPLDSMAVDGKIPGKPYRFCKEKNISNGQDPRGWDVVAKKELVSAEDGSKLSEYGSGKLDSVIRRDELILCDATPEWKEERDAYFAERNRRQEEGATSKHADRVQDSAVTSSSELIGEMKAKFKVKK